MGGPQTRNDQLTKVGDTAGNAYNQFTSGQTPFEKEYIPQSQEMWNNYSSAAKTNMADYGNIMSGYEDFSKNLGGPTKFGFERVSAERPAELTKAYGYLDEAMPGYRDFASTGGYSPTDIQELRARGISPIRSAYSNTMMEMDRARALGGAGGSPNYIAAASKAQRELPGQMADAMTGVNAGLAESIRAGKIQGLAGISGIGATMGGMAGQESGRMLQAGMANQNADLQAQQLSEQSLQNLRQHTLAGLQGRTSLYGTSPGMASTFGNQALSAYSTRAGMENSRNNYALGLLNAQTAAYGGQSTATPWWKQVLDGASSVLPYLPTSSPTTPGQPGPQGPQGTPGANVNSPVTPGNWYNNAPPMPQINSQNPSTSSNWYVQGQQPSFNSYDPGMWNGNNGGNYGSGWDPYLDARGWNTPSAGNPWDTSNFSWSDFGPEYTGSSGTVNPWEFGQQVGGW